MNRSSAPKPDQRKLTDDLHQQFRGKGLRDSGSPRNGKFSTLVVTGFLLLFVGVVVFQWGYLRRHRPLAQAALAEAELRGPGLMKELGLPPGATGDKPVQKSVRVGGRKSMWRRTPIAVDYVGEWETPGTIAELKSWYREHLPAQGWRLVPDRHPDPVQSEFRRENWWLTVEHATWLGNRSDPRVRFRLRLEWDYRRP